MIFSPKTKKNTPSLKLPQERRRSRGGTEEEEGRSPLGVLDLCNRHFGQALIRSLSGPGARLALFLCLLPPLVLSQIPESVSFGRLEELLLAFVRLRGVKFLECCREEKSKGLPWIKCILLQENVIRLK